jgi:hypothetical protein
VGKGRLLVCSADLEKDINQRPAALQLRRSLLAYAASDKFQPTAGLSGELVRALLTTPPRSSARFVRTVVANSDQPDYEAEKALDGDPDTMWHTAWGEGAPGFPHAIEVEFSQPQTLRGFTALPRQDGLLNGWIQDYEFYVSDDGRNWGKTIGKGTFAKDSELKTVVFAQPVAARFIKLTVLSSYSDGPWASLAELDFLPIAK